MPTHMRQEIDEIPEAAARLLTQSADSLKAAGKALRDKDPAFLITIARGSSDHAAHFIKYAVEQTAGRAVASIGPSLASIYGRSLKLDQAAAISISQSGKSPDIVALAQSAARSGALTISLTNTLPSPLSDASAHPIDIQAGPELAVAATKSFFNSVLAGLAVLAEWTQDRALLASSVVVWVSAVLSAVVDNIPYVATMAPIISDLGQSTGAPDNVLSWALALGADLGGNATAVGASANVVVLGIAARNGHPISFWQFTKYGLVVAFVTVAISWGYLVLRYFVLA